LYKTDTSPKEIFVFYQYPPQVRHVKQIHQGSAKRCQVYFALVGVSDVANRSSTNQAGSTSPYRRGRHDPLPLQPGAAAGTCEMQIDAADREAIAIDD
jgi:hypothetical protein